MMGIPDLMTAEEVARELGYADRSGLHRRIDRGDVRLAVCRLPGKSRRSWSRARLIAAGYLAPVVAAPQSVAGIPSLQLAATWPIAPLTMRFG